MSYSSGGEGKRKPVYWWTTEIAAVRSEANKARRILVRTRRKRETTARIEQLYDEYKRLKGKLKLAIIKSKSSKWKELVESVHEDVWGKAYILVVKSSREQFRRSSVCKQLLR